MTTHHMGNLLKRSSMASFNHRQTYTSRNLIEQANGRIGKHVSPIEKARIISLDSEYGVPYMRNSKLKVEQLKVYQENFNLPDPDDCENVENPQQTWQTLENLQKKDKKCVNNPINYLKMSQKQFDRLRQIVADAGKEDEQRRTASFKQIKTKVALLDDNHESPVNSPLLKPTIGNEIYARSVGNYNPHFVAAGFFVNVVNKDDNRSGSTSGNFSGDKIIKAKVTRVELTSKGLVPNVEMEGMTVGEVMEHKRRDRGKRLKIGKANGEASEMALKFGFLKNNKN
eukprot:NODE_370_length_9954_cov_0.501776.p5 type:complete len:284 gc:universal NODE_370_length_9954_cov_0.501776:4451-3600(-)